MIDAWVRAVEFLLGPTGKKLGAKRGGAAMRAKAQADAAARGETMEERKRRQWREGNRRRRGKHG